MWRELGICVQLGSPCCSSAQNRPEVFYFLYSKISSPVDSLFCPSWSPLSYLSGLIFYLSSPVHSVPGLLSLSLVHQNAQQCSFEVLNWARAASCLSGELFLHSCLSPPQFWQVPPQRSLYQRGPSLVPPKIQHPFPLTPIILYPSYSAFLFFMALSPPVVLYNYYFHLLDLLR